MSGDFELLGVRMQVEAPHQLLVGVRAFLDAYDPQPYPWSPVRELVLRVERGELPPGGAAPRTRVHRSKHEYWNFDAEVTHAGPPLHALWPSRQLYVELPASLSPVRVVFHHAVDDAFAGEGLFHLMRSLALYLRMPGNLLHASAVVHGRGAVLFVGHTLSGKTTLLTEAVLACGARPLANDRVLLPARDPLHAVSWPSYCSFCEGTLLGHRSLTDAALAYERDDCAYRTRRWPEPLVRDFSPQRKRTYPMIWFTEATATRFVRHAPLSAIVFSRLDLSLPEASWSRLEPAIDAAAIAGELAESSFDRAEPSFLPWHGLAWPSTAPELGDLIERASAARVRFFRLAAPPAPLPWLPTFLDEVNDA